MKVPTPLKGWRTFAGEVGVIVLGVLLALWAQEVAASLEMRNRVTAFRTTINAEIADTLWVYHARKRQVKCTLRRLDALDAWLNHAEPGETVRLLDARPPMNFGLNRAAWDNRDAVVFAALPEGERRLYASFYDTLSSNLSLVRNEREIWGPLERFEYAGVLDLNDRRQIYQAIKAARRLNSWLDGNIDEAAADARGLGIERVVQPDWVLPSDLDLIEKCPPIGAEPVG